MSRERQDEWNQSGSYWGLAAGVGLAAGIAGGLYWLTRGSLQESTERPGNRHERSQPSGQYRRERPNPSAPRGEPSGSGGNSSVSDYLSGLLHNMNTGDGRIIHESRRGVDKRRIPSEPVINNCNSLLNDIYVRYVALDDGDFELYYKVFTDVFHQIHRKMKEVDPYYNKYSSTVQLAGSHFDRLRIGKPDEFDVDIVIGLPLDFKINRYNPSDSDIVLEPKDPGFVQLRMGRQFGNLYMRDGDEWQTNKEAYKWKDDNNYLLRSKFMDWFKGVVDRALNEFQRESYQPIFYSEGVPYTVRKSESGPARTLYIENRARGFQLDVDLVPALRFPEERWPINRQYREIPPNCSSAEKFWMVVPKPNKNGQNGHDMSRSWRIALHVQERKLMHDTNHLRQTIRLLKKLRDAQEMKKIASYYVKTLVYLEVVAIDDRDFWSRNHLSYLFKHMVAKFHKAMVEGNIPYFWNKNNNLIDAVPRAVLDGYAAKLQRLKDVLDNPDQYKEVARFLLTRHEFREYNQFLNI